MTQFWLPVPPLSSEMLRNGQGCCEAAFLLIGSETENGIECCSSYAWPTDQAFRRADQDLAPRMRAISAEVANRDKYCEVDQCGGMISIALDRK
jgi:hypothetical protein